MAKIDVYLRSIERFGAAGAILTSGQPVTMRFPTGDRHATQVTPHDQLVGLVREVAPPPALDQIDKNRPAKFDVDSNGTRYSLSIAPKPGLWQVTIELAATAPAAPPPPPSPSATQRQPRMSTPSVAPDATDMAIERGQYDVSAPATTSGSIVLDQLTATARAARATDVYLATGTPPALRVAGELQPTDRPALDAETLSRELGIVAPGDARAAWTERGIATFAYGDGVGRVRVALARDHRGPVAALRLLVAEAPPFDRLGLPREAAAWLDQRGLVLVAGASGAGKTTTVAAFVRALGERKKRVVAIEDPIEIVHVTSPWVSQRAVGDHVASFAAGVGAAMREGADVIVLGAIATGEAAGAALEAVAAGHLVLAAVGAFSARDAADYLVDLLPPERRELARSLLSVGLIGVVAPVAKAGVRTFEMVAGRMATPG